MAEIRKAYADTPLGQVHYQYTKGDGSKKYPVVFLHMSATSSKSFDKLLAYYGSQGYYCVAPDMPGFGSSFDTASAPPDLAWYVNLYMEIFKKFPEFTNGCHLVGHHSGGAIGVDFAVLYPDFVKSLTVIGPVIMGLEERLETKTKVMIPFNQPVSDGSHLTKTWEYLVNHGHIPATELDYLHQETLDHARAWKGRLQIYDCVFSQDSPKLWKEIKCPLLALCSQNDTLWSIFHRVKEVRPDVPAEEVVGANFSPYRGSEKIIEFMNPFLDGAEKA